MLILENEIRRIDNAMQQLAVIKECLWHRKNNLQGKRFKKSATARWFLWKLKKCAIGWKAIKRVRGKVGKN